MKRAEILTTTTEPRMHRSPLPIVLSLLVATLSAACAADDPSSNLQTAEAGIAFFKSGTPPIDTAVTDLDLDGIEDEVSFLVLDRELGTHELAVRFGADGQLRTIQMDGFPGASAVALTTAVFTNALRPEAVVAFTNPTGKIQVEAFQIGANREIQRSQSFFADSYQCTDARGCYPTLTAGNFDNDALDELVVGFERHNRAVQLGIFDSRGAFDTRLLKKWDVVYNTQDLGERARRRLNIAAVDYNADGRDELATVYRTDEGQVQVKVIEVTQRASYRRGYFELRTYVATWATRTWESQGDLNSRGSLHLKAGNLVGDRGEELALLYHRNGRLRLRILNPGLRGGVPYIYHVGSSWSEGGGQGTIQGFWLGVRDADGDEYDDVGVFRYRWSNERQRSRYSQSTFAVDFQTGATARGGQYDQGYGLGDYYMAYERTGGPLDLNRVDRMSSWERPPAPPAPAPEQDEPNPPQEQLPAPPQPEIESGRRSIQLIGTRFTTTPEWGLAGKRACVTNVQVTPPMGCRGGTVVHTPHGGVARQTHVVAGGSTSLFDGKLARGYWHVTPTFNHGDICDWNSGGVVTVDYDLVPAGSCD
jgi:hypothetical protein